VIVFLLVYKWEEERFLERNYLFVLGDVRKLGHFFDFINMETLGPFESVHGDVWYLKVFVEFWWRRLVLYSWYLISINGGAWYKKRTVIFESKEPLEIQIVFNIKFLHFPLIKLN
jgi:hypothetical protein